MKNVNTFGIQFVIRKHRIKDGEAPIYARMIMVVLKLVQSV